MTTQIDVKVGIHNRFDIEVIDAKTGEVKQKARAFNVITNKGFEAILNNIDGWYSDYYQKIVGIADCIVFGSGTGTPSANDTTLFHYEGSKDGLNPQNLDASRATEGIFVRSMSTSLSTQEYVGVNLTEIGLTNGYATKPISSSNPIIFTHAMLQDMNGNPISIHKTDTDIINIYAKIYLHYNSQHSITLFDANGPTPTFSYVGVMGGRYNGGYSSQYLRGWIRYIQFGAFYVDEVSTSGQGSKCVAFDSWTPDYNNKTAKIKFKRLESDKQNIGGIGIIYGLAGMGGSYANDNTASCAIATGGTAIPPSTVTNEVVGVGDGATVKFKTKTCMPRNAKVYINGVEQTSGVTVHKRPNVAYSTSNISGNLHYFRRFVNINDVTILDRIKYNAIGNFPTETAIEIACPDIGVWQFTSYYGTAELYGSNDGTTWVQIQYQNNTPLAQADAHYKYYKCIGGLSINNSPSMWMNDYDGYNIIFDNPPASGDVISVDYTTDFIPKDSDHVLDFELNLTFGEYQGV